MLDAVTDTSDLLAGPLEDRHREHAATFAPFGGWLMPVAYAGTVGEHTATRESVGLFDVSHLGKALVSGPGAAEFVNSALTNDLRRIGPGQAQYTLCCTSAGGVIDDLIAYYVSDDEIFLVPNAANTAAVVAALHEAAPQAISVTNEHRSYAVLAVQGPRSAEVLSALGLPADMDYMGYVDARYGDAKVRVCRTGYTGEHGYELLPEWASAPVVFDALAAEVAARGGQLAGLGARDTLRTEMGYPLHGQELSLEISPVEASASWAVGWKKESFIGSDVLVAQKSGSSVRKSVAIKSLDRGIPRAGMSVKNSQGEVIGEVTSGTFSPSLKHGIALVLVSQEIAVGDQLTVDVRGRDCLSEVVKLPFVTSHVR